MVSNYFFLHEVGVYGGPHQVSFDYLNFRCSWILAFKGQDSSCVTYLLFSEANRFQEMGEIWRLQGKLRAAQIYLA